METFQVICIGYILWVIIEFLTLKGFGILSTEFTASWGLDNMSDNVINNHMLLKVHNIGSWILLSGVTFTTHIIRHLSSDYVKTNMKSYLDGSTELHMSKNILFSLFFTYRCVLLFDYTLSLALLLSRFDVFCIGIVAQSFARLYSLHLKLQEKDSEKSNQFKDLIQWDSIP